MREVKGKERETEKGRNEIERERENLSLNYRPDPSWECSSVVEL